VPFSLEELTADLFLDTVERSMVNELAPQRDQGVMLQGQFFNRVLGYSLGVFNGSASTPRTATTRRTWRAA
jgi:hypothetical protein